jgi:hypothetical protein
MKVVCLIRPHPRCVYFVNRIHEAVGVSLAVVEAPSAGNVLAETLRDGGILKVAAAVWRRIDKQFEKKYRDTVHGRFFGEHWHSITPGIPVLEVERINAAAVYERLNAERPDVLLDVGTTIVGDRILEAAKLALNLHAGLSPYYRGSRCTDWALINWDPYNIGVTVHEMSPRADGGRIFAQARPVIAADDTGYSLDMQLTKMGTDLMLRALEKLEAGEGLGLEEQDITRGFVNTHRQWSPALQSHIRHIEKEGMIGRMLQNPSTDRRQPIVELDPDP